MGNKRKNFKIVYVDKVFDNVHGVIEITEIERKIIQLPIFKRLQNIKQLSFVNRIFPGAEHTRYIHSIGVMYIADKMAISLGYNDIERQLIRLAGLLHDLGHYPLSHEGERAYKSNSKVNATENVLLDYYKKVISDIEDDLNKPKFEYMEKTSNKAHHEQMTICVIESDNDIKNYIKEHNKLYNDNLDEIINIQNICDIIIGNVERDGKISPICGYVQLIHSELDADRIDYLMRDSLASGTCFGNIELELLIKNMTRIKMKDSKGEEHEIIGIKPKGIPHADYFLISRFFSYTQVVFNKHVSILCAMIELCVSDFIQNRKMIDFKTLHRMVSNHNKGREYLDFTDMEFWKHLINSPGSLETKVEILRKKLLECDELKEINDSEIVIVSDDFNEVIEKITNNELYKCFKNDVLEKQESSIFPVFKNISFTDHIPLNNYETLIKDQRDKEKEKFMIKRLQDGICVIDNNMQLSLLVDNESSLMSKLYLIKKYFLRFYEYEHVGE